MLYQLKLNQATLRDASIAAKFLGDPVPVYTAFLSAIAARNLDQLSQYTTRRYNANLRQLRRYRDFSVWFQSWCKSYPTTVHVCSCVIDEATATLEVEGTVASECVRASVVMRRCDDGWRVDQESLVDRRKSGICRSRHSDERAAVS